MGRERRLATQDESVLESRGRCLVRPSCFGNVVDDATVSLVPRDRRWTTSSNISPRRIDSRWLSRHCSGRTLLRHVQTRFVRSVDPRDVANAKPRVLPLLRSRPLHPRSTATPLLYRESTHVRYQVARGNLGRRRAQTVSDRFAAQILSVGTGDSRQQQDSSDQGD